MLPSEIPLARAFFLKDIYRLIHLHMAMKTQTPLSVLVYFQVGLSHILLLLWKGINPSKFLLTLSCCTWTASSSRSPRSTLEISLMTVSFSVNQSFKRVSSALYTCQPFKTSWSKAHLQNNESKSFSIYNHKIYHLTLYRMFPPCPAPPQKKQCPMFDLM